MIRIKVYKASHLVMGFVALLVVIALAAFVLVTVLGGDAPASALQSGGVMAEAAAEEEVVAAFAAAPFLSPEDDDDRVVKEVVFGDPTQTPGADDVWENEHTDSIDTEFIIEVVPSPQIDEQVPAEPEGDPLRILIYHTHTHEAYQQVENDRYEETEEWRTTDENHSIVRVGEELKKELIARGYEVVHDTTDHEPPKLGTAYTRSLETLKRLNAQEYDVCIDVHRDAYGESVHKGVMAVSAGTKQLAQLMILIGNGEGFEEKPDFQGNYQFAKAIGDRIDTSLPGLSRGVLVKNGRYNQHVGKKSILLEVGHNLNTLDQALGSVPFFADALDGVLKRKAE